MDALKVFYVIVGGLAGSIGIGLILADGQWSEPPTTRQAVGCCLFIVGAVAAIVVPVLGHRSDINDAYHHGYEVGHRKGRRSTKPILVGIKDRRRA